MFIFHIYPYGSTYFYKGLLNLFSFIFIRQVMLGGRYFTTSLFFRNPFKSRIAHKENSKQILDEKKYKILEQQHEMSLVVPFVWENIKNTKNTKKNTKQRLMDSGVGWVWRCHLCESTQVMTICKTSGHTWHIINDIQYQVHTVATFSIRLSYISLLYDTGSDVVECKVHQCQQNSDA